ncbi:GntR family transcriptional regulator [Fodinicola acaciae]|uniref:GntR family transcriptional regulator n=1 Tax=Fodinicola acaciae TaxID=2681555 RepID=UPI0013D5E636|nr:GntR family transcriptional regulator [Fodinicola acaciae]
MKEAAQGLQRQSSVPLYRQLKERIVARIQADELRPHDRLPSERELIETFGVSRITVRQALTELMHEGRIYSAPGKGFFLSEAWAPVELNGLLSFTELARKHHRQPGTSAQLVKLSPSDDAVAAALRVTPGEPVVRLHRVRTLDGSAVLVENAFLPMPVGAGLLDSGVGDGSLFATLTQRFGFRPARSTSLVTARLADDGEAQILDLATPAAVLVVEQITFDASGAPMCVTYSAQHPHRFPLTVTDTADGLIKEIR